MNDVLRIFVTFAIYYTIIKCILDRNSTRYVTVKYISVKSASRAQRNIRRWTMTRTMTRRRNNDRIIIIVVVVNGIYYVVMVVVVMTVIAVVVESTGVTAVARARIGSAGSSAFYRHLYNTSLWTGSTRIYVTIVFRITRGAHATFCTVPIRILLQLRPFAPATVNFVFVGQYRTRSCRPNACHCRSTVRVFPPPTHAPHPRRQHISRPTNPKYIVFLNVPRAGRPLQLL